MVIEPIQPSGQRPRAVAPVDLRPLDPIGREAQRRTREEARRRRRRAASQDSATPSPDASGRVDVRG
jgi:hypothetical protein